MNGKKISIDLDLKCLENQERKHGRCNFSVRDENVEIDEYALLSGQPFIQVLCFFFTINC